MSTQRQVITRYYDSLELNELILETFGENETIAEGFGLYPQIHPTIRIHWVAVKGAVDDWIIVYLEESFPSGRIKQVGDKMFTQSMIKMLVPCTPAVFANYRF